MVPRMRHKSHGDGSFRVEDFAECGPDCVFEAGVLVFHPEKIRLGRNIYFGHHAIIKGYWNSELVIGDETWIGQQCFMHSAGGLTIGSHVGIGPGVRIITSQHQEVGRSISILDAPLDLGPVIIEDEVDIGMSSTILPGVTIGRGALIGAGSVVTRDVPPYAVVAGVPARVMRERPA